MGPVPWLDQADEVCTFLLETQKPESIKLQLMKSQSQPYFTGTPPADLPKVTKKKPIKLPFYMNIFRQYIKLSASGVVAGREEGGETD